MLQARGVPVSDSTTGSTIAFGPGALDVQSISTYNWQACILPTHYYDSIAGNDAPAISEIIQPQTGLVATFAQTG